MAFRKVLLISLLLAVVLATPEQDEPTVLPKSLRMAKSWKVRALRRSRKRLRSLLKELANLENVGKCRADRRRRLRQILQSLQKARSCRYRGVGFTEYSRLRALCRDRSEIDDELAKYRKKCLKGSSAKKARCFARKVVPLRRKLKLAFAACRTIGWKGDGRKERFGCLSVRSLKQQLKKIGNLRCGRGQDREKLLEDIRKTKRRIAYLLGLVRPVPSARPRRIRG